MTVNSLLFFYTCLLILVIVGGLVILPGQLRRERIHKLHRQGRRVRAVVINVRQEREERGPSGFSLIDYCYFIEAQWTDPQTEKTYLFRSNRLASSPKEYSRGKFVHVLIDPHNPERYILDLPEYEA